MKLIQTILEPNAFDYLRNIEQLGYSVGVAQSSYAEVLGFKIWASSQEGKNPYIKVLEKLDIFMHEIAKKAIEELTDEDFEKVKKARINELDAEDIRISQEVNRNWNELKNFEVMFNRKDAVSVTTKTITKLELQEMFTSFTQPENMRRLSVQVIGNQKNEDSDSDNEITKSQEMTYEVITEKSSENENLIENIEDFQKNLVLYPVIDTTI